MLLCLTSINAALVRPVAPQETNRVDKVVHQRLEEPGLVRADFVHWLVMLALIHSITTNQWEKHARTRTRTRTCTLRRTDGIEHQGSQVHTTATATTTKKHC